MNHYISSFDGITGRMYPLFRSLLFRLNPEAAHHLTIHLLRLAGFFPPSRWFLQAVFAPPEKPVQVFGMRFRNPLGVAAGYDKDCEAVAGLNALGWGHIELGTVTLRPQPGNPKPRVFRLLEDEGVINRMGFPGKGAEYASSRLPILGDDLLARRRQFPAVIGVNLGKNKDTPLEAAADDYTALMRIFAPRADYLTINISSPNTVGLRRLQGREMLEGLLGAIRKERLSLQAQCPILVKIAPDLSDEELEDAIGAILDNGMDGIIATNTTLSREGLRSPHQGETGGLSGKPLTGLSEAMLGKVLRRVNGQVPVISVGGIFGASDAKRRLDMGAALVQVYTGMVYKGPGLLKEIVAAL